MSQHKTPLDIHDYMPNAMRAYISNYGFHFNKKACELAVSLMTRKSLSNNLTEHITMWGKEQVDSFLEKQSVKLENKVLYDYVYVLNMGRADYFRSTIEDEKHLALYVKDTIDDVDGSDELPFRFWLQKMIALGEPIEWEDIL